MNEWFHKVVDASAVATSSQDLKNQLVRLTRESGFSSFSYLNLKSPPVLISNASSEWQKRYIEKAYPLIDPILEMAKRKRQAFIWSASSVPKTAAPEHRRFYAEAAEFEIRAGISIPVRVGFGRLAMITLAAESDAATLDRQIDPILAANAATLIHARFHRVESAPIFTPVTSKFKPQEIMCLKWAAEGKTMREISKIEGMKYSTVRFHLAEAKSKLNVFSLRKAITLAMTLKLI